MKTTAVLCFLVVLAVASARPEYTNKYDNINIDDIVKNRRLLVPYLKCVLDQGKCSPEGRELKCKYPSNLLIHNTVSNPLCWQNCYINSRVMKTYKSAIKGKIRQIPAERYEFV